MSERDRTGRKDRMRKRSTESLQRAYSDLQGVGPEAWDLIAWDACTDIDDVFEERQSDADSGEGS